MKLITLIITFYLLFPINMANAYSDNIKIDIYKISYMQKLAIEDSITKTELFFNEKFKLKLNKEINVYIVPNYKEYRKKIYSIINNNEKTDKLASMSSGVCIGSNVIIVIDNFTERNHIQFVIGHELTHQLQFQELGIKAIDNMWKLEGTADYVGYSLSYGLPRVYNQGINKDEIKSLKGWQLIGDKYGYEKLYKQCLYEVLMSKNITIN